MTLSRKEIRICLLGDVVFGQDMDSIIQRNGRDQLRRQLWQANGADDVTLINLEGPLTQLAHPAVDKRINLSSSPSVIDVLSQDVIVGLANNHIFDYGPQGLTDTVRLLKRNNISYGGAGDSLEMARRPVQVEVHGQQLGVLFAADPRYNPADKQSPGTFPATSELLMESVGELRGKVDWLVISLHIGFEYTPIPTPYMRSMAKSCLAEGADVVYFHHAHRLSGVTREKGGVVIWGSGNYVFCQKRSGWPKAIYGRARWSLTLCKTEEGKKEVSICLHPLTFDKNGFPVSPSPRVALAIREKVERWSRRIKSQRGLLLWSWLILLNPFFLRSSLPNYLYILRRQGVGQLVKRLMSSVNLYWRNS